MFKRIVFVSIMQVLLMQALHAQLPNTDPAYQLVLHDEFDTLYPTIVTII